MSQEEMIEQLRAENAQLKEEKARESAEKAQIVAENRQLRELVEELRKRLHEKIQEAAEQAEAEKQRQQEQIEVLSEQVHELEGRVAKNSSNSSKPPSTDGYAKKKRSLRQPSGKKPGGQAGHPGSTRSFVQTPDEVVIVRPENCPHCQASLQGVEASGYERRQKVDLPQIKARVTEYQAQDVRCPCCQQVTRGTFPDEVRASIQFGPMVKGIALYLLYGQLLPYARTAELLTDLCGCPPILFK
jgi:transposase